MLYSLWVGECSNRNEGLHWEEHVVPSYRLQIYGIQKERVTERLHHRWQIWKPNTQVPCQCTCSGMLII